MWTQAAIADGWTELCGRLALEYVLYRETLKQGRTKVVQTGVVASMVVDIRH